MLTWIGIESVVISNSVLMEGFGDEVTREIVLGGEHITRNVLS